MTRERIRNENGSIPDLVYARGAGSREQGAGKREKGNLQDQSCNLTVGELCGCGAEAHPTVAATFLGLEPIA